MSPVEGNIWLGLDDPFEYSGYFRNLLMGRLISNPQVKKDSSFLETLVIMPSGIGQIRI